MRRCTPTSATSRCGGSDHWAVFTSAASAAPPGCATADLAPEPAAVAAIEAAAAGIVAHCNADHPDALAAIAGSPGDWRMVTVDVDGCDLAQGERVIRIHWSAPVTDAGGVRRELIRLAREARAG